MAPSQTLRPAYRRPPNEASGEPEASPVPRGCQEAPSQAATCMAATPPALVKLPLAMRRSSCTASEVTLAEPPELVSPSPRGDHAAPSQRAMLAAGAPPALAK